MINPNYSPKLTLSNNTTAEEVDIFFSNIWKSNKSNTTTKTHIIIDTSNCTNISVKKILGFKHVLDKHRESSRKHIDFSTVVVKNTFIAAIIRTSLCILKTERPVRIVKHL